MFRRTMAAATVALGMFAASQAAAATVTLDTTLDISSAIFAENTGYTWDDSAFPTSTVTLSEGDVLEWFVRFTPTLELERPTRFSLGAIGGQNSLAALPTGTLEIYGPGDTLLRTYFKPSISVVTGSIAFNVNRLDDPNIEIVPLDVSYLRFVSGPVDLTGEQLVLDRFGVSVQNTVPEPTTWSLMILGFGTTGAILRRRQRWAERVAR